MFYGRRKSFEYLNSPKFQFVKSLKWSDLCSKIYEKSLNEHVAKISRNKIILRLRANIRTIPNLVAPTMLGVVACVLAVVCKRMQQLPTMLGPALHRGKDKPISLCKPCIMSVCGPNNVGRAVQTDPTLLRYASAIMEQKKFWELLAETFDRFQT